MDNLSKTKIFISYSHRNEEWKDLIKSHFTVSDKFSVWNDRDIKLGENWFEEIEQSIYEADIAILLISKEFLNSSFIKNEEIPRLLSCCKQGNVRIVFIQLEPCAWQHVEWISTPQGYPKDNKPLSSFCENNASNKYESCSINEQITNLVLTLGEYHTEQKVIENISKTLPSSTPKEPSKLDQIFLIFNEEAENSYSVIGYIEAENEFDSELIEFTFTNIYDEVEQKNLIELLVAEFDDTVTIHFILPPELFLVNFKQWRYRGTELVKRYHILLHNKERFGSKIRKYSSMIKNWNNLFDSCKEHVLSDAFLMTDNDNEKFDTRLGKIGVCFKQSLLDYKIVNNTMDMAKVGLWQYREGIIENYHLWVEGNTCLKEVNLKSRECDHLALLWDDMSLLEELKRRI